MEIMDAEAYSRDCELVLGLVSPVGVNLDLVNSALDSYLNQFSYRLNYIHLSQLVANDVDRSAGSLPESERLDRGMTKGNEARETSGQADIFALLAIDKINNEREVEDDFQKPLGRVVHVLRSLKHPDEVETLRQVYGPGFFLLGISSSIESRKRYLISTKGVSPNDVERLIARDDREDKPFGQKTRDVFQMADAFATADNSSEFDQQIGRILDLLFSSPVISPTADEYAMFMAYAASLRSADLSRQVGAVVVNKANDILSAGANDVPKFGGGLYWPDSCDQRDYIKKFDSNEKKKDQIILSVMKELRGTEQSDEELLMDGKRLLKDTGLLDITEYGRAVHAEMEALLSAARNGVSTRSTTLFTTTYPCHNCAKHIVAAGVNKVKFIEPYPKSYATELHGDSIESNGSDVDDKVKFEPFVGIGPRKFVDLFSMSLGNGRKVKRKERGELKAWSRINAELRVPMTPFSYIQAEAKLVIDLKKIGLN